jgi:23S rRNA (cytosine1962-C5)-methyltransferase
LVADRFGQYVVIELFSLAMFRRLEMIQDAIIDAGLSVKEFIVRVDKLVAQHEGINASSLPAAKATQTVIDENGVKFQVQLAKGHKTGFFCDQRENRLALVGFTPGKSVLDMCCYSGGFACYAGTLGAAKNVTAVDLDENALVTAKANARLNEARIEFHHADAFDFLRNAANSQKQWDAVVVDPSKFVQRRDEMEIGLRKYTDLNRLAAAAVAPGGLLLSCSCSGLVDQATFVAALARGARAAGRALQIFRITAAGPDHPFMADSPQSAYLKAVWARLD